MQQYHPFRDPLLRSIVTGGSILLVLAAILMHLETVCAAAGKLLHTVRPLLLGVLFATMLEPSYRRLTEDFTCFAEKKRFPTGWIRPVSLGGAILPPVLVLVSIVCVLIPQVVSSARMLSDHFGVYSENLMQWLAGYAETPVARIIPRKQLEVLLGELQGKIPMLLMKTYDYTAAMIRLLLDTGIGAVFSLYLLAGAPQMKARLRTSHTGRRICMLLHPGRRICTAFACFVASQCKESLILGVLCWTGMELLHFPYPLLISAVIGMTNIVPYIGPLAGTVPCVLLLLLVAPESAVWFVVYIVVLQQIESNLIYPRVVGQSVGLPPAWVLAAIVTGGGLFGVTGMVVAVPLTAALYAFLFGGAEK